MLGLLSPSQLRLISLEHHSGCPSPVLWGQLELWSWEWAWGGRSTYKGTRPSVYELEQSSLPFPVLSILISIQRALTQSLLLSGV